MPFRSRKQAALCFAKKREAERLQIPFTWDCSKWAHETDYSDLPEYKIYKGKRGGLFYMQDGKKVYLKKE